MEHLDAEEVVNIIKWALDSHGSQNVAVSSMLIGGEKHPKTLMLTASEGWIICVRAVTKHNGTSEVPWDAAGSRTQVHVPKAGGLGCKEMKHREQVRCQRLVLLTLLQRSVIHETAPFTPSPSLWGVYRLPVEKEPPPPIYCVVLITTGPQGSVTYCPYPVTWTRG